MLGVQTDGEQEIQPRPSRTGRDMVISLVVLLIPVALIVTIFRLRGGEDTVTVDPSAAIAQARTADLFPVIAPVNLPPGWRSVSAVFQRQGKTGSLRVGYLSPSGDGVQLVESSEPLGPLLDRELGDRIQPAGPDAGAWKRYSVRTGETAFVRVDGDRTVIVVGQASAAELAAFTASLR
jgi:hypothetical protein